MAEVLAPCLHRLDCAAGFLAELGERFAERMWVEVRQSRLRECVFENGPDARSVLPEFTT
jgi:hypothetical protein